MSTFNLKHATDGKLMHGPHGHLVDGCGAGPGCACAADTPCANCPDVTPLQFHVTFTGITLCLDCVACDGAGISFQIDEGSSLNGTYLLTQNGDCAWTASSMDVPCTGKTYSTGDCSGASTPLAFAVQQVRISSTQFELQVTDDSNTILLFNATLAAANCCAGYTVGNGLTTCGCAIGEDLLVTLGTGGTATVIPC
jgi:hypothetical protein